MKYAAVVIGASAGGVNALTELFSLLDPDFPLPVFAVQHLQTGQDAYYITLYQKDADLEIVEVDDKMIYEPGMAYFAPPDYHLLVEDDGTLSLSSDEKVNYCRPSADVLFESAAEVFGEKLIGVVLTGANNDGAAGAAEIARLGGPVLVQDPAEAPFPPMPRAAAAACGAKASILKIKDLADRLNYLASRKM